MSLADFSAMMGCDPFSCHGIDTILAQVTSYLKNVSLLDWSSAEC